MQKNVVETTSQQNVKPLTVLVVDDSPLQRRLLTGSLDKWGYEVFEAQSGRDALEISKATRVDLILSDWVMPEMDGLTFCQEFRKLSRDNYGYFILLTSKDDKKEIAKGLVGGADDFLTKPVNSAELRARLHAGERVLEMQNQLVEKNREITDNLAKLQGLYEAIDRDLEEAKKLQHSLVPETFLKRKNAQVSLKLQSSGHIGGDMVGYYYRGEHRLGLYSFDVSGHGVSSALMTARLAGCLGASNPAYSIAMEQQSDGTFEPRSPEEIATRLNTRMLDELDTDLYLTIALADVDLKTGSVTLVQAGHPHPMVLFANGDHQFIGQGGMPVGLIPDASFPPVQIKLSAGDSLLLYSDGFTEAENVQRTMLDEKGLSDIVRKLDPASGPEFLDDLVWQTQAFTGARDITDDLSAVYLQFL